MRKIKNSSRDLISCFPTTINQKLIDGYRVKLFAKIKDSLDKNAKIGLNRTTMQELDRTQKRSLTGQ